MKKILVYNSGGGLGDPYNYSRYWSALRDISKTKFYYLGAHTNHFVGKLKEYNIHLETIDLGWNISVFDGGIYYLQKKEC